MTCKTKLNKTKQPSQCAALSSGNGSGSPSNGCSETKRLQGNKTLPDGMPSGDSSLAIQSELDAVGGVLTSTGKRLKTMGRVTTTPAKSLATPEQQDAFCEDVIQYEGVAPASRAVGMNQSSVYYWANTHPEFRKRLTAALASLQEKTTFELEQLFKKLLAMTPKDMNLCANAYGRLFEYRIRMLGKLNSLLYGDRPQVVNNTQTNIGLVCDEETRARLIALRKQTLLPDKEAELLPDVPVS